MSNEITLGYAVTYSSSNYGYLGALLISDYKGFPLEFRYTDPIVPTKIQQVLYGKGLEKYLKVDVITDNLLKAISAKLDVLLIQDEDILDYKTSNFPIVRISGTKASPLSNPGEFSEVKKGEYLLQTSHANNPIRLQFNKDFVCEGEAFNSIMAKLTEAGNFMDVEEPLSRVSKSIELICSKDS